MISGTARPFWLCAAIVVWTIEKVELTFTPRLTSLEMPVETSTPWLSTDEVPVLMTVCWLSAVDAPVDATVAMLTPDDTAAETEVMIDLTEDMPTVAVDSEPEKLSQMLFSVETLAWVDVVVVFDWADDSRVPIDVTLDSRVDSDWVADKATLWAVEIELATDARVEVLTAWLTLDDWVVLSRVETLTSSDLAVDTTLDTDVAADSTAELDVPSEVAADVIADVEMVLLTTTSEERSEDIWVDATVAILATEDTPVEMLLSPEIIEEILPCSADIWLAAVEAPVETFSSLETAVEMPVLARVSWLSTVEMPTVTVDSDVDSEVKALKPDDTWALVGLAPSATIVEMAVEKSTPSDVADDRPVLSEVAPESAVELTRPAEVVVESAADVMPDSDVWADRAELDEDDSAVFIDWTDETSVVCEVWADSSLEMVDDSEASRPSTVETFVVFVSPIGSTLSSSFVSG